MPASEIQVRKNSRVRAEMKSATTNGFLQMSKTITSITTTNHARRL